MQIHGAQQGPVAIRSIRNPMKTRIVEGELAIGLGVRLFRDVEIVGLAVAAGYDWLFIDLEHGSISLETVAQISNTAMLAQCAPIVRVPAFDFSTAGRAFDNGALGAIFPHVDTAEQARSIIEHMRYPPTGRRSFAARQPAIGFAAGPAIEVMAALDNEVLIFAMVESALGIENAAEIAAVPGVDALFVGANDLAIDLGIPDQFNSPQFRDALDRIVDAGSGHGKAIGVGGIRDGELMQHLLERGVTVVLGDMEATLLVTGGRSQTSGLRALQAEARPVNAPEPRTTKFNYGISP